MKIKLVGHIRRWFPADGIAGYIVQRLFIGVLQVAILLVLLFVLVVLLPGDAADVQANDVLSAEQIQAQRDALGLSRDPYLRFAEWVSGVFHGDLGTSLTNRQPVAEVITQPFVVTSILAFFAILVLTPLVATLGFICGLRPGSRADRIITTFSIVADSIPDFVLALFLVAWLSLSWGLLPATLMGVKVVNMLNNPQYLVLPLAVMISRVSAPLIRQVRAGVINVMAEPYIIQARRLGVSGWRLLTRHAAPNALAPAMQELGRTSDGLLSGVLIVEAIFVVPGVASTLINAISTRDEPVVLAVMLLTGTLAIVINIGIDVLGRLMVPRSGRQQ